MAQMSGRCLLAVIGAVLVMAAEEHEDYAPNRRPNPRYVMCPTSHFLPSANLGGKTVRVFAASVTGNRLRRPGRLPSALALRAALLVDENDPKDVVTDVARVKDGTHRTDNGHASHVNYAKCFGTLLPEKTEVACQVGKGQHGRKFNSSVESYGYGRIIRFSNGELRHDFAHCVLGQPALRWIRTGAPNRLIIHLAIDTLEHVAVLPLELCKVQAPIRRISFCSQPLYGFESLRKELPWVMEDWLAYHLDHLGFDHAEIYDIDGSFEEAVKSRLARGGTPKVTYHPNFPANLSTAMTAISRRMPYCSETWAYAHCLTTQRALSRWVMLLHAPDEYVAVPKYRDPGVLQRLMHELEKVLPENNAMPLYRVTASSFARSSHPSAVGRSEAAARGGIILGSKLRSEKRYWHTPLIDPDSCVCSGPHACYAESDTPYAGLTHEVNPAVMVVHHYVEMLDRNVGRCEGATGSCDVDDDSLNWVPSVLRAL